MDLPLAPSYAVLCLVQGLLVLAPWKPYTLTRSRAAGLLIPVLATAAGSGSCGVLRRRRCADDARHRGDAGVRGNRRLGETVAAAVAPARSDPGSLRHRVAVSGHARRDAAGLALIGGACLTLAALIAALTPPWALAVGLVVVVAVDVVFVWGIDQVEPATIAVHQAVPPSAAVIPGLPEPLPALQDGTFGSALMGWLDFLAPALLGTLFVGRVRVQVAVATTLAALAWGLLLLVTDPVAATVPVLAGLAVGGRALRADSGSIRRRSAYAPAGAPPSGTT